MKIIPLADRVVIKTVEVEETTKGGLILTGSAKEKPQVAQVIAVGPGGVVDGKEVKMTVKVGDKVLTSKYSGTEVKVDGEEVSLTNKEFELLCLLLEHQGMAMTRDAIMDGVWGQEFSRENRTLDVHVRTLRTKLGPAGHYIETVRGVGYKMGGEGA